MTARTPRSPTDLTHTIFTRLPHRGAIGRTVGAIGQVLPLSQFLASAALDAHPVRTSSAERATPTSRGRK